MVRGDSVKGYSSSYGSQDTHLFDKPFFQYLLVIAIIGTFIVSVFALVNVYQLKNAVLPKTVNINDFLKKLTAHEEMKGYVGVAPLNIIQINNNNFANLQQQISGLDVSYVGSFILQYT